MRRSRHLICAPALFFLVIFALFAPVAICNSFPTIISQIVTTQEDTPVEYRMVEVPDVVGMDLAEARSTLGDAKLNTGWIQTFESDLIPKNQVVEQNPAAGMLIAENEAVDMIISFPAADDDDNDELADAWEYENFGSLTQGLGEDFDGDGYNNYQEYLIGTDPGDPGEAPIPAGNYYQYDEFGRIIRKQITLDSENEGKRTNNTCEGIDCGEDTCGSYGNWYCRDENIRRRNRICTDRGCAGGGCYEYNFTDYTAEFCSDGCLDGNCMNYAWHTGTCSVPCGGGTRSVYCQRNDGTRLDDNLCSGLRPAAACNTQKCPEMCYYDFGNDGTYFYEFCRVKCTEYKYEWSWYRKEPVGCLSWTFDCYWKLHFKDKELVFKRNEMAPDSYKKKGYVYRRDALMRELSCDPRELRCMIVQHWWGVATTRWCKNCGSCN